MSRYFNKILVLGFLLSSSPAGFAAQPTLDSGEPGGEITVRLYNYAQVPEGTLARAETIAEHIFRHAGIETTWLACPTDGDISKYPACRRPLGPRDLVVRIMPQPKARYTQQKHVLGFALLPSDGSFGNVVNVYFERVEKLTFENLRSVTDGLFSQALPPKICTSLILGCVIAHEMGHLLLGSNSHSRHGIMRPNWSRQDLEDAYFGRQCFTSRQAKRLHADVRVRALSAPQLAQRTVR